MHEPCKLTVFIFNYFLEHCGPHFEDPSSYECSLVSKTSNYFLVCNYQKFGFSFVCQNFWKNRFVLSYFLHLYVKKCEGLEETNQMHYPWSWPWCSNQMTGFWRWSPYKQTLFNMDKLRKWISVFITYRFYLISVYAVISLPIKWLNDTIIRRTLWTLTQWHLCTIFEAIIAKALKTSLDFF